MTEPKPTILYDRVAPLGGLGLGLGLGVGVGGASANPVPPAAPDARCVCVDPLVRPKP